MGPSLPEITGGHRLWGRAGEVKKCGREEGGEVDARAGDPAAPKLLCAGSLALPTLRPVRHPQPTHLLESPCLPYPLTNRTPSPLGAPTSPGRFPPHSPSPPGAPSPRTPNPLYLKVALLPPTPGHQPPRDPSPWGVPAADSGQSTRRTGLGPAATSSWAGGGASQPQPQGVEGGAQGQSGDPRSHPLPRVLGLCVPE